MVFGASFFKRQGKEPIGGGVKSFVTRSLLKPWQYLSANMTEQEDFWSVALGCHSGQDIHIKALAELAKVAKADEHDLICPRVLPIDGKVRAAMKVSGARPSRIHHPCAGKHLLMLAACDRYGYRRQDYWHEDHPVQKQIHALVGRNASKEIKWVQDDCGLPTAVMSVECHLNMWEKLALDENQDVEVMRKLWVNNPILLAGHNRLTTDLLERFAGRILVKEAGGGLLMVQSLPEIGQPVAGAFVKLASGFRKDHLALGLYALLKQQEKLPAVFEELLHYLYSHLEDWVPEDQTLILPPH